MQGRTRAARMETAARIVRRRQRAGVRIPEEPAPYTAASARPAGGAVSGPSYS